MTALDLLNQRWDDVVVIILIMLVLWSQRSN